MPTAESDQMLTLLQEKAVLKKLDEEYAANPKGSNAKKKYRERRRRHAEIAREMVDLARLAKQKKED
jgi:hypothetical protein